MNDLGGAPQNVTLLSVGPGFLGGGPLGTDGAGGGQLLLDLNGFSISTTLTDGETFSQAANGLYAALIGDGFVLAPPDSFGNFALNFSNSTNFILIGSPSLLTADFGFSSTADNLNLSLDTFLPEPASLTLFAAAIAGLFVFRSRPRRQSRNGPAQG